MLLRPFAAAWTLIVGVSSASAQINWTYENFFVSSFVLNDLGKKVYRGPGVQNSITGSYKNCYVNIWDWRAFSRSKGPNYSEVDYTFGCSVEEYGFTFSGSMSYFDLPKQFMSYGDIVQANVAISKRFAFGDHTITPYVGMKPTFPLGPFSSGVLLETGVFDLWKLPNDFSLQWGGRVLYDTGAYDNTPGWNYRGDAVLIYSFTPTLDLKVGLKGFVPITNFDRLGDVRKKELVGWSGIAVRF